MHHFRPHRRSEAVAFVERLLGRGDFPIDHLAGILCDCADSGLTERADRAEEFASRMDDGNMTFPMASAEDVRKAFRDGAREDIISGRAHNVYGVNRRWGQWAESWDRNKVVDKGETGPAVSPMATLVSAKKVGRNDPCPCGSGKKYKKCHGR